MNALKLFFINMLDKFPKNPFDFDTYLAKLDEILPVLNWFIPFYKLAPIFHVWYIAMISSFILYIVFRFLRKVAFHD